MRENIRLAMQLEYLADGLEILGDEKKIIRDLRRVAKLIESCDQPVSDCLPSAQRIPWFRSQELHLRKLVEAVLSEGPVAVVRSRMGEDSPRILEILRIRGISPEHLKGLSSVGVDSMSGLQRFLDGGKAIPGLDLETARHVRRNVDTYLRERQGLLGSRARRVASDWLERIREWSEGVEVSPVGSFRRCDDIVFAGAFVVSHPSPAEAMARFKEKASAEVELGRVRDHHLNFVFAGGLEATIAFVRPEEVPVARFVWTGESAHVSSVESHLDSRGLQLCGYTLYRDGKPLAIESEEKLYQLAGLPFIPPELRQGRGEIALALRGELPVLVDSTDIRGDLHSHSVFSDGRDELSVMVQAAEQQGHSYLAITDHTQNVRVAGGLAPSQVPSYLEAIDRVQAKHPHFRLLAGLEVDILADGALDMSDAMLDRLDIVVAAVHGDFDQGSEEMMARLRRGLSHPRVHILAHPTARMLGQRSPLAIDPLDLLDLLRETGVAVELNSNPRRLDLGHTLLPEAVSRGIPVVVSTDAHSGIQISNIRYGLCQARRGGLTSTDVLNTLEWDILRTRLDKGFKPHD